MSNFVRNSIEYYGIDCFTNEICIMEDTTNFKQSNVVLELCLPKEKPDMEQVSRVKVDKNIVSTKVVRTPVGVSLEGQRVTGYKVVVMADIILEIIYVSSRKTQSVHSFHVTVPFCEYVVMPEGFNALESITSDIYIEDIYIAQKDCRCLYGSVTVMTVVDPCLSKRGNSNV